MEKLDVSLIAYIVGTIITVLAVYFSRADKANLELKKKFDLLFVKLDQKQDADKCELHRMYHNEKYVMLLADITSLGLKLDSKKGGERL